MARLYLDSDVRAGYVLRLRSRGHDAVHVKDFGTFHETDDYHLSVAALQGRVLVTHNRDDYILLHRAWRRWTENWRVPDQHPGILVVPQDKTTDVITAIDDFFALGLPIVNLLYVFTRVRGWTEIR